MARKIVYEILHNGRRFFSLYYLASLFGFSKQYFRNLILKNKLKAEKINNNWFISENELEKLRNQFNAQHFADNGNDVGFAKLNKEIKTAKETDPWDSLLLGNGGKDDFNSPNKSGTAKSVKIVAVFLIALIFAILLLENSPSVLAALTSASKVYLSLKTKISESYEVSLSAARKSANAASAIVSKNYSAAVSLISDSSGKFANFAKTNYSLAASSISKSAFNSLSLSLCV